jgi:hypothetical protein
MRVLVISSPRDMLFDSGFQRELFDADGAAPTSVFSTKSVKLTDRSIFEYAPHLRTQSRDRPGVDVEA